MGSIQQISLGLICLVAAFAFGNYVNNNPPANNHPIDAQATGLAENADGGTGNVQSRLAFQDLNLLDKRPAPIATMRNPIKQKFGLPVANVNKPSAGTNSSQPNNAVDSLPPPSQLAGKNKIGTGTKHGSMNGTQHNGSKSINVPDFSQIAAEFKNTPIELPELGAMPSHSQSTLGATQPVGLPLKRQPETTRSLGELASQFDSARTQTKIDSASQMESIQKQTSVQDPFSVVERSNDKTWFNADSFEPKLHQPEVGADYSAPPTPDSGASSLSWNDPQGIASSSNSDIHQTQSPFRSVQEQENANVAYRQPEAASLRPTQPIRAARPDYAAGNQIASRVQIGGIDYDVPPPPPPSMESPNQLAQNNSRSFHSGSNAGNRSSANPSNQVRSKIPFQLTEQAKSNLSRLTNRSSQRIENGSTKYRQHQVRTGDSLQSLSTQYFGRPEYYLDIYLANRHQMRNPADIKQGMTLRIPVYQ